MLKLSNDRKVSPSSVWEAGAKRYKPIIPNAFGLPAASSCPGKTAVCESICYAARTERTFTSAGRLVDHNFGLLAECGDDVEAMASLLAEMIDRYRAAHDKAERKLGAPIARVFRIHWDGDFFSSAYAQSWAKVIRANADVQFWAYTRSFVPACNVVPDLVNIPNLALYLSVDAVNVSWAQSIASIYGDAVHLAYLADTAADGQADLIDMGRRKAPACPENVGRIPLVGEDGQGACVSCGLCVFGRKDVVFSITKK